MRIHTYKRFRRVVIDPGEFFAAEGGVTISTLLGSCIAACLFDPVNQVIGMNHFLLSAQRNNQGIPLHISEAGRYGLHAMELLINSMVALGAQRKFFKAKVFGGASMYRESADAENFLNVGRVNCAFIREFLKTEKIPLMAESLGGATGRVIHFTNGDFAVYMRKIDGSRSNRVAERDHQCWLRAIETQKKAISDVDLWM